MKRLWNAVALCLALVAQGTLAQQTEEVVP